MMKNYDFGELSNKFVLTFEEACAFFSIREKRLRRLIHANEGAEWILYVGNRHYIKRGLFEKYINNTACL